MSKKIKWVDVVSVTVILVFAFAIYCTHWRYELPFHPHADEPIVTDGIMKMIGDSIQSSLPFNYPHLSFYIGYFAYKIGNNFITIYDYYYFFRVILCGIALFSNVCMYFVGKRITCRKPYGYICLLISLFSFYQFQYLYYTGPDVLLYALANIVFLVAVEMFFADDEKALSLYPLIAILIGLAISAKYHGVLLGALWLAIHIARGYARDIHKNKRFIQNCFLILLAFFVCNWKILLDPQGFIDGFLFNFKHYAGRHQGIEHNMPLLAYFEAWVLYGFGFLGAIIFILGIIFCFKHIEYKKFVVVILVVPVIVLSILSRSTISLGRNISLILPVFYIFEAFGILSIESIFVTRPKIGKLVSTVLVWSMVLVNICGMLYLDNYDDSYEYMEKWIDKNIEMGSIIYIDSSYAPYIDNEKYDVKIAEGTLPTDIPNLAPDEYYVTSGLTFDRYLQRKDYYFMEGGYMYPDDAEEYMKEISKLQLVYNVTGVSGTFDSKFRLKYKDFFNKSHKSYFKGPTINVYRGVR